MPTASPQPPTKIPVIHAHHTGGNQAVAAQVAVAANLIKVSVKIFEFRVTKKLDSLETLE